MVMAGTESVSGPPTDEALSNRLQWLRQRREALQEKLTQKNNELKHLCVEEAELTGVLPPEIPLEPGESPPILRKRAVSNFNYPQNLINKIKTSGDEESSLELERQVQINIAEEALSILNNTSENKAVRRKHRSLYQQSQRRLQELNAQLNFIRQSHGGAPRQIQSVHIPLHSSQSHLLTTAKHRTKKPRPPLDCSGKDLSPKLEARGFLQEGGISLSPLSPEHNYNSYSGYGFQDLSGHGYPQAGCSSSNQNRVTFHAPSPVDNRRNSTKLSEHDLNANNNVYVASDQFRNRAYSQGGSSSNSVSPHLFPERVYRPVPNTYTEEERQMHYRQMKLKKQEKDKYSDSRYLDNDIHRKSTQISFHETDFGAPRCDGQMHDYTVQYNHGKSQQPLIPRQRDTVDNSMINLEHKVSNPIGDAYVPPGYWMRLDDEIVWCSEEQMAERFGSLDRRKQNVVHHPSNIETQSRYHTVALSGKNAATPLSRPYPMQPQVSNPDVIKQPSNRILLRTQSLGSVEAWQPTTSHDNSSVEGRESADSSSRTHPSIKLKEKEWYETSLDTGPNQSSLQQQRNVRRASHHNSMVGGPTKDRTPMRSNSIPSNRRLKEQHHLPSTPTESEEQQQLQRPPIPQNRYMESRVLEIPAESKPATGSQENGNEQIISLNSPTNHTVVQPGMYQPYREVTKPFEMSDFYKYSTKFRKRVEANSVNDQQPISTNINEQNQSSNPMNQKIHQPVQRNTCPSYSLR